MSSKDLRAVRLGRQLATKMRYAPYQLFAPLCFLVITVDTGRRHTVLKLGQPWDENLQLVFDIFGLLGQTRQQGRVATLFDRNARRSV